MPVADRNYTSTALTTVLSSALGASGNPSVISLPGTWPTEYPFPALIDWGDSAEEAILVTSAPTGTGPYSLPCTRGIDGTTAQAHAAGASVNHGTTGYEPTLIQANAAAIAALEAGVGGGSVTLAGDLGNTNSDPQVLSTHLTDPLPENQGGTGSATQNWQGLLTPVTQTGTYTATAGQLVKANIASSSWTMKLPNAPANNTIVGAKVIANATGNAHTLTVECNPSGSDVFEQSGGATSVTMSLPLQTAAWQYNSGYWTRVSDDLPLGQLDSRYGNLREFPVALYSGADPTGATDSTAAITSAIAAATSAGGGIVSFGSGTWMFQTIVIPAVTAAQYAPVHFRFAGPVATVLTPLNANSPLFRVSSGYPSELTARGVRFDGGFTVWAHADGSTGPAIDLNGARQFYLESVSYWDSGKGATESPGTYAQCIGFGLNTYACHIVDPVCESQTLGACFIGSISNTEVITNANFIENPLCEGNTCTYVIDAAGTMSLEIRDGIIEGNTCTAAIRLGKQTVVRHSYFEANETPGGGGIGHIFAMDAAGVDGYYPSGDPGADIPYDPGGCLLEMNEYYTAGDTLTIPAGVTPGTMVVGSLGLLNIADETDSLLINFQPTASTTLLNNASGGTSTTVVTTGNSGGASGTAWSAVTGSPTFSNTETYSPSALSYKLATSASNEGFTWNLPSAITAGQTIYLRSYVYFSGSVFNTSLVATNGLWYQCGVSSSSGFYAHAYPGTIEYAYTPSANTWYRLETEFDFSAGSVVLNVYDALGNLLGSATSTGDTEATAEGLVYFGQVTGGTTTGTLYMANCGLTNGTWLGPAIPGVESVTAADGSIVVTGTQALPTIATGTLDVVATQHPPAANWSNNGQKITSLANGSASTDAAAFGQLPSSSSPLALTAGGTGLSESTDAALVSALGGLLASHNLSDLASVSTAQVNLGLGSAAIQAFAPTYYENSAAGGSNTTAVTTVNSGSTSGNAFGGVTGTVTFDNSEILAAGSSTLAYKLAGSASTAYVTWSVPNTATPTPVQYMRTYFYLSATSFACDLLSGPGLNYRVTYNSGGTLFVNAHPGSTVDGITTLAASTWYRLEAAINQAAGTLTARLYNANGVLLETITGTGGTYASNGTAYYGSQDSYTGTIWLAYPAWSNAGWIGP
jgi:hypothetical protein